jgi:hypothetical protein
MYGIELEYENLPMPYEGPDMWELTGDGSLRNDGIEFVSMPLSRDQVAEALDTARDFLQGTTADPSPRCGIHVHLNMRGRTIGELFSFNTAYVLMEPSIFQHFCPDRVSSSFCVPFVENSHMISRAHESIQLARASRMLTPLQPLVNTSKYSALNMSSLPRFGTVEVRSLPSTLDFRLLRRWITMLTRLYDASVRYNDPTRVVALYDGLGIQGFQDTFLNFRVNVPQRTQARAYQAASIIAGYAEPTWQELHWNAPTMEVE